MKRMDYYLLWGFPETGDIVRVQHEPLTAYCYEPGHGWYENFNYVTQIYSGGDGALITEAEAMEYIALQDRLHAESRQVAAQAA